MLAHPICVALQVLRSHSKPLQLLKIEPIVNYTAIGWIWYCQSQPGRARGSASFFVVGERAVGPSPAGISSYHGNVFRLEPVFSVGEHATALEGGRTFRRR